jgi:hypothetical protein
MLARLKRSKHLFWYAWLELLGAIALSLDAFGRLPDPVSPFRLVTLLASLFAFTRSFDNFHQARKKAIEGSATEQETTEEKKPV